MDPREISGQLE